MTSTVTRRLRTGCVLASLLALGACGITVDPPLPDRERYAEMPPLPDASFWPKPAQTKPLAELAGILRRERAPIQSKSGGPYRRIVDAEQSGVGVVLATREVTEKGELVRPDAPPDFGFSDLAGFGAEGKSAGVVALESAMPFWWNETKVSAKGVAVLLTGEADGSIAAGAALREVLLQGGYCVLEGRSRRVPSTRIEYVASTMKEVTANARRHARLVDAEIASQVYAVEAMLAFFVARREALRALPLALVGVTDGAAIVPALALRLHGRVGAAALIGGGADLVALDQSRYALDRRVVLSHAGEAEDEDGVRWFRDVYARDARLDPFAAAVWLRATPTEVVDPDDDAEADTQFRKLDRPLRLEMGENVDELLYGVRLRAERVLAFLFDPDSYRGEEPERTAIEVVPFAEEAAPEPSEAPPGEPPLDGVPAPDTPAETPAEPPIEPAPGAGDPASSPIDPG